MLNDHSSIQTPAAVSISARMIRQHSSSAHSRLRGYFSMAKVQLFDSAPAG